jgi:protein TonB
MRIRILDRIGIRHLKIFFSISAGLHLLFLSGVTFLFPDFKIDPLPPLNIEISLLPIVAQEKTVTLPVPTSKMKTLAKKEEKKPVSPFPLQPELQVNPMSVLPLEDLKPETSNKEEERVKKEPAVQAMANSLDREAALTFQEDKNSEGRDSILPTLSSSGEQRKEAKFPSLSDVEMLFAQPRYAENPKPIYPREARKKEYQGEVILKVEVLSDGQVGQVEVKRSSGHDILDRSALAAVRQWRFIPAKRGENAIPLWVNIPIKFQLQ